MEKTILSEQFIDSLPYAKERVINKYIKQIGKEVYELSKKFEANGDTNALINARCEINKRYGKFWRERLNRKKIFDKRAFSKVPYYFI